MARLEQGDSVESIESTVEDPLDKLIHDVKKTEADAKKLLKDLVAFQEALAGLQKSESKMVLSLGKSALCSVGKSSHSGLRRSVSAWCDSLSQLEKDNKNRVVNYEATCLGPLKDYLFVLGTHHAALQKRESAIHDYTRSGSRWRKVEKEGKYSVTAARLAELRNHLTESQVAMKALNSAITNDLTALAVGSQDLFQPLFLLIAQTQKIQYRSDLKTLSAISGGIDRRKCVSERDLQQEMKSLASELEALSIMAGAATLLTGQAAISLVELSHEQRSYLFRTLIASEFPAGTAPCETAEHCDSKHRCDATIKVCVLKESPEFPLIYSNATCEDNSACPFLYRCHDSLCEYTFFKACKTKLDCFQHADLGLEYDCRERSEQMPGKQCYRKCVIHRDCWDCNGNKCRYPETFQKILSCCDGYCSRKISCDA
ncbi:hypothetical protein BV898_00041 [Hypsibius exemplaris]|uniref:Uncharacterized protein n=1 Tax=Hypsibius exemplaris TaxID=2072580 RepID=A0A1W0XER7_HYPEX|nr:hypothetical protein BV898_00041 [Hypsibius exemplaris]